MSRSRRTSVAVLSLLLTLLAGCAAAEEPTPNPTTTAEPTGSTTSESGHDDDVDEHGVLTEAAVTEIAPRWAGSTFEGDVRAFPGHDYGGDCRDSAWDTLYLFESMWPTSTTFQATGGVPAPSMTIAVVELGESERAQDLDSLDHQLTSCIGEGPEGTVLQEPASTIEGWSGLHVVAEDRDVYWAEYDTGIVAVQLQPGEAALDGPLAEQVRAVMALQLEQLG